jgi:hypothetical protein
MAWSPCRIHILDKHLFLSASDEPFVVLYVVISNSSAEACRLCACESGVDAHSREWTRFRVPVSSRSRAALR